MKQTAVEWLANEFYEKLEVKGDGALFNDLVNQAKEMEKEQQLELIQFLSEKEDFKENSSISIFIAEDYLNQFKNK